MSMMDMVSSSEAAALLKVHPSRVRALVLAEELPGEKIAGRWLVDRRAVLQRARGSHPAGRPFSPRNAWRLVFLASGRAVDGLSAKVRWRLNRALRGSGLPALQARLIRRGAPQRFNVHPGELAYLAEDDCVVLSGISAAPAHGLALVPGNEVEAYVRAADLATVIKSHALHPAEGAGNVLLRVVPDEAWLFERGDRYAPPAAVAFDLIEGTDARSVREGMNLLRRQARAARV
jgi:hypothetical protein